MEELLTEEKKDSAEEEEHGTENVKERIPKYWFHFDPYLLSLIATVLLFCQWVFEIALLLDVWFDDREGTYTCTSCGIEECLHMFEDAEARCRTVKNVKAGLTNGVCVGTSIDCSDHTIAILWINILASFIVGGGVLGHRLKVIGRWETSLKGAKLVLLSSLLVLLSGGILGFVAMVFVIIHCYKCWKKHPQGRKKKRGRKKKGQGKKGKKTKANKTKTSKTKPTAEEAPKDATTAKDKLLFIANHFRRSSIVHFCFSEPLVWGCLWLVSRQGLGPLEGLLLIFSVVRTLGLLLPHLVAEFVFIFREACKEPPKPPSPPPQPEPAQDKPKVPIVPPRGRGKVTRGKAPQLGKRREVVTHQSSAEELYRGKVTKPKKKKKKRPPVAVEMEAKV